MLNMLCVDSNNKQRERLIHDLAVLNNDVQVHQAISLKEAELFINDGRHRLDMILSANELIDGSGIALFSLEVLKTTPVRKIMYSQSPSTDLLLDCINHADLDKFIPLPCQPAQLISIISEQITRCKTQALFDKKMHNKETNSVSKRETDLNGTLIESNSITQDRFLDFSLYSDADLSTLVINSLYEKLEEQDFSRDKFHYSANHILTEEGENNDFLWFITKGEVLLQKRNAHGLTQDITTMKAGSIVGGMSFLTTEMAFSTAVTVSDTEVIKLDQHLFAQIMQSNSDLLAPFTHLLLRNFNRRLQQSISTELALQETLKSLDAAYQQLLESEKMVVLGQLVAGVAHELNNPVSAILRGSETLISLVPHLLPDTKNSAFSELAQKTLSDGLSIRPLATSEVRKRARAIRHQISDKNLAKKMVNMQLDQQQIPLEANRDLTASIQILDKFHQAGTILRNSNACANRIHNLVQSLKHYAGHDTKETSSVDVHEGLEETLIIFESRLKNYLIIKNYHALPHIECYPIELEQVWTNLISNALDATGKVGKLVLSTYYLTDQAEPRIQITVEDNGPGINKSIKEKIFELNYTTKREGNFGLGIGLTISSQIIKRHNGTIEVGESASGGAKFIITLPVRIEHHTTL